MSASRIRTRGGLRGREVVTEGTANGVLSRALRNVVSCIDDPGVNARVSSWSDEDYEYTEVKLPPGTDLEVDLNIHGATVLIRTIRDTTTPLASFVLDHAIVD